MWPPSGRCDATKQLPGSHQILRRCTELSERFKGLRDPNAAITWARELMGVSKKLLTPSVIDAVVEKVSQKRITNSKDLRKLRAILPDPVARENFLSEQGDLETASLRIAPERKERRYGSTRRTQAADLI